MYDQYVTAGITQNPVGRRPDYPGDAALAVFLLAGLLDLLDGALAHYQGNSSRFGPVLDSTLDRISEGTVLAAITYRFAAMGERLYAALATLAVLGSVLVSYSRARAEALGVRCTLGLATRPERITLIVVGLCANLLPAAMALLVIATLLTTVQRPRQVAKFK